MAARSGRGPSSSLLTLDQAQRIFEAGLDILNGQSRIVLEELSEEYEGQVKIVKLDTDANPETTGAYGIVSIPTLNVYVGGELQRSIIGARPKRALAEEIDAVLTTAS